MAAKPFRERNTRVFRPPVVPLDDDSVSKRATPGRKLIMGERPTVAIAPLRGHEQRMLMRPARAADADAIWAIIAPTIRAGETYALDRDLNKSAALDYWMGSDRKTFVAEEDGAILGTYYLRPNQHGGGRHVCNCGYMIGLEAAGRGIARQMYEHSAAHAQSGKLQRHAVQFRRERQRVRAVRLWQSLGFEIVGRLPGSFSPSWSGGLSTRW